jgi:hypothetical protein
MNNYTSIKQYNFFRSRPHWGIWEQQLTGWLVRRPSGKRPSGERLLLCLCGGRARASSLPARTGRRRRAIGEERRGRAGRKRWRLAGTGIGDLSLGAKVRCTYISLQYTHTQHHARFSGGPAQVKLLLQASLFFPFYFENFQI